MKNWLKIDISAVSASLLLHVLILAAMAIYHFPVFQEILELEIDSVVTEEREQEEFSKQLNIQTEDSPVISEMVGGALASTAGPSNSSKMKAPPQQTKTTTTLEKTPLRLAQGRPLAPTASQMNEGMGELAISGETGAIVEGYGDAMHRMTQELLRLLRDKKLLVVWLFDESGSMKDDQKEIANNFQKVYGDLGLALAKKVKKKGKSNRRKGQDKEFPLLTSVVSYGASVHSLTKKPTSDVNEIRSAILKISEDKSGKENMCTAILKCIKQYTGIVSSQKRKLVFIVVTDESGDDNSLIESAVERTRRFRSPVYILGREAIFGYTYAHVRWFHPGLGHNIWVKVNRGPETAYPENMQWDGLSSRHDAYSSGFGPYAQVRLAKESGGVFFVLPGKEQNLAGAGANEKRKFDFLDMKEYQPLLLPRRDYVTARGRSTKFRSKIWDVIATLNPNENDLLPRYDKQLNIKGSFYGGDLKSFKKDAAGQVGKAARSMQLLSQAIAILDNAEKFRATEESQRWRASYDLMRAQCFAYRVRLYQYLLATDDHVAKNPKFVNPKKSNAWHIGRTPKLIKPDELQYRRLMAAFKMRLTREEYFKKMDELMKEATDRYRYVIAQHPGTPWARLASNDIRQGFGVRYYQFSWNPPKGGGGGKKIVIPKF